MALLILGVLAGILLGWWLQYRKALRVATVRIGAYDADLEFVARSEHGVDMMAITFAGLSNFRSAIHKAAEHGAKVRVLLLNPASASFVEYAGKRDERRPESLRGEYENAVQAIKEMNADLDVLNAEHARSGLAEMPHVEVRFFDSFPYRGCIITDTEVRYWPYLHHVHPSAAPTYQMSRKSEVATILKREFDTVWGEARSPPRSHQGVPLMASRAREEAVQRTACMCVLTRTSGS